MLAGGGAAAQGGTVNTTITGNTIAEPGDTAGTIIVLKQGVHFNTSAVQSFVTGNNDAGSSALAQTNSPPGGGYTGSGTACP